MPESTQQKYNFNLAEFDHWAQMAVVDPDAFEARRSRLIEAFISSVPPERQPRLRGLHRGQQCDEAEESGDFGGPAQRRADREREPDHAERLAGTVDDRFYDQALDPSRRQLLGPASASGRARSAFRS